MMKISIAMMAALAFAPASAHADTYKGRLMWVDDNSLCGSSGPRLGDRYNAVFHEYKNVSGERFTSLNAFRDYGGDGKRINDDVVANDILVPVSSAESIGADSYDPLSNPNVQIAFSIDIKNKGNGIITMIGRIRNPWGDETLNACVVNYLFTGLKS